MQSEKNPFKLKTNHADSCKFDSREYFNYKQIHEDSPIDYDAVHIQHQSNGDVLQQKSKKPISRETEDMRMEIQLCTTLLPETEKELQEIFTFQRVTPNELLEHRIRLPIPKHKITLFIDLDETLICSQPGPFRKEINLSEIYITKCYNSIPRTSSLVYFAVRPFFREFLKSVSSNFDIVVNSIIRFSQRLRKTTQTQY
jgi:hypothetical protein